MATYRSYILGFVLSVGLTLLAYFAVVGHFQNSAVIILVLALVQLIIQLIFFLHLGQEPKPRVNLLVFFSTLGVIFILVAGALWIMHHLNYRMTPDGSSPDNYIIHKEEGWHGGD